MANGQTQGARSSLESVPLESLLDKLVAIQIDLDPFCGTHAEQPQIATPEALAGLCEVLTSAIADVRSMIYQVDGLKDLSPRLPDR
jgi:hypothetical protein